MSNSSIIITPYLILNLTCVSIDFISFTICITFLSILFYRLVLVKQNQVRVAIDIPLILCINLLCILLIKIIIQTIHITVPVIQNDFKLMNEYHETFLCRFRVYMLWSLIGVQYWIYTLLVFFRFTRVIYPTHLWLHRPSLYLYILIPGQYILVFVGVLIILFIFNNTHLLSNDVYCDVPTKPFYTVSTLSIIIFGVPYTAICVFYTLIIRKMFHSTAARQVHTRRDYAVLRRIGRHTIVLSGVSIPCIVSIIMYNIDDRFEEFTHRIVWFTSSMATFLFSSSLPFINTTFQQMLKGNQILPNNNNNPAS